MKKLYAVGLSSMDTLMQFPDQIYGLHTVMQACMLYFIGVADADIDRALETMESNPLHLAVFKTNEESQAQTL